MPAEQTFVVALAIDGRYYATVTATSPREAMAKAEAKCADEDFGALEYIDYHVDHIETQTGKILDPDIIGEDGM